MMAHRHMSTAAPCSRLTQKSHHTLVRPHCSYTSHGIVLNASRNLDGNGAWSQTAASGNVPCLCRSRGAVLIISKHGRVAGSVDGTCCEEHRVDAETRVGGSSEYTATNSTRGCSRSQQRLAETTKWANWTFTFRAHASAVSPCMVVLTEHALGAADPLDLPTPTSEDGAMKRTCGSQQ